MTLLITDDFPPRLGGVATYYSEIAKRLPAGMISVLTAPLDPGVAGREMARGFPVYREPLIHTSPWAWPKWTTALSALRRLQRQYRFGRWWVGQVLPYGTVAWRLHRRLGVPYLVTVHGMDIGIPRGRRRALCGLILRAAHHVVANSQATADRLSAYGVPRGKVSVITPGVNHPTAVPATGLRTLTERYHLAGAKVILTVGRLVERKNHRQIISVVPSLLRMFPGLKYVIAGDGPYRSPLQALAHKTGISDHVIFTGEATGETISAWYELADAVVMVPRRERSGDVEGFGMTYLEASSHGKPVIGADLPGIREAVAHGLSGLLVSAEDDQQLLAALKRLLQDSQLAHRLGLQGQDRAVRHFSWDARARQYAELLA